MTTAGLYARPLGRPTVSFEIFPPRTPAAADSLWRTVQHLAAVTPDYISVTFGASGSTRESSRAIVRSILAETPVTAVAHLTCVGASRAEVAALVGEFLDEGVRSILALRGDPPKDEPDWRPHPEGLAYASELVALIRQIERDRTTGRPGAEPATLLRPEPLSIAVAAYPGGAASPTRRDDVAALLAKQEAGADYALTQVFYDPAAYVGLVREARGAGVHLPIVPGLIPMTDPGRLSRLEVLTGVTPPADLMARLAAEDDPVARHRLGIRASVDLARAVLDAGAPGIHLYTFNKHEAALDLLEGVNLDGGAPAALDLAGGPWVSAPPTPSAQGRR
jgi:methylenetetrahydrofolate reductase (NADPH)